MRADSKANIDSLFGIVMNEERQRELERRIKIIG
jgi:hypothetical protein